MKVIGITGGVGAGKTAVLSYIRDNYNCKVVLADEVAHQVKEPGEVCYERLIALLGKEVLWEDGTINKSKMAEMIFYSDALLEEVNAIIHPAVKESIERTIAQEKEKNLLDFLIIEAALLIEAGYMDIVDEMWYIYADEAVRRERLKATRGYSDEKIDSIMEEQLSEAEFKANCKVVIDNSRSLLEAYEQVDKELGEALWQE